VPLGRALNARYDLTRGLPTSCGQGAISRTKGLTLTHHKWTQALMEPLQHALSEEGVDGAAAPPPPALAAT
jgi:hypothetical protein